MNNVYSMAMRQRDEILMDYVTCRMLLLAWSRRLWQHAGGRVLSVLVFVRCPPVRCSLGSGGSGGSGRCGEEEVQGLALCLFRLSGRAWWLETRDCHLRIR